MNKQHVVKNFLQESFVKLGQKTVFASSPMLYYVHKIHGEVGIMLFP